MLLPAATGDVQGNIQSAIQKDPTLATANVTVNVTGKTVELTGTVPNKDAKDSAERIAKENAGGLKVKNHLKIAAATPDKAKSAPAIRNSRTAPKSEERRSERAAFFYGASPSLSIVAVDRLGRKRRQANGDVLGGLVRR